MMNWDVLTILVWVCFGVQVFLSVWRHQSGVMGCNIVHMVRTRSYVVLLVQSNVVALVLQYNVIMFLCSSFECLK